MQSTENRKVKKTKSKIQVKIPNAQSENRNLNIFTIWHNENEVENRTAVLEREREGERGERERQAVLHQLWTNVINLCLAYTVCLFSPSLSLSSSSLSHSPSDLHNCKTSQLGIKLATGNGNANALARTEIYFNKPCDNDKLIIWHFVATFRSCCCLSCCLSCCFSV